MQRNILIFQKNPDYNKINEFVASVNERIVKEEV